MGDQKRWGFLESGEKCRHFRQQEECEPRNKGHPLEDMLKE
jgi:hypothetical protein